MLVLWLGCCIGICKFTCKIIECGGVVMFVVPGDTNSFDCDIPNYCDLF